MSKKVYSLRLPASLIETLLQVGDEYRQLRLGRSLDESERSQITAEIVEAIYHHIEIGRREIDRLKGGQK